MSSTLREIPAGKMIDGDSVKRWFHCPSADLYTWQDTQGNMTSFEFSFGKPTQECVLRWSQTTGATCARIDDGERTAFEQKSPMFASRLTVDPAKILQAFQDGAAGIELPIYQFIWDVIRELDQSVTEA